jgi:hypothetical protein
MGPRGQGWDKDRDRNMKGPEHERTEETWNPGDRVRLGTGTGTCEENVRTRTREGHDQNQGKSGD